MTGETAHNLWPFTERSAESAPHDFEVLFSDPEIQLTEAEKAEIRRFGEGLFKGQVGDIRCSAVDPRTGEIIDLEEVDKRKANVNQRTYYPGYFETSKGRDDLAALGVSEVTELEDSLRSRIADGTEVDQKARRLAAVRSDKWFRSQLIEQLTRDSSTDAEFVEPESFTVHFTPATLLEKYGAYKAYKDFYRRVGSEMQAEPESSLKKAKETLLALHRATVNYHMANLYPAMWRLAGQLAGSEQTERVQQWVLDMTKVAPLTAVFFRQEWGREKHRQRFIDGFARRLDLLRYGAVYQGAGEDYSPISPLLYDFVTSHRPTKPGAPALEPEVLEAMKHTSWKADQFKSFLEAMLHEWDLLSEHQATWEEAEDREGAAEDNKWQVIISAKADNLNTDSTKKTMIVPADFERTLLQQDPSGPIPVGAHECEHVLQAEANDRLAEVLPLAKLKGRRYLMMHEMGGVREEKPIFELAGEQRRLNEYYLRGLARKLAGGNIAQVSRVVYDVVVQTLGREPDAATRQYAVDRARRLYRYDGRNSQPLDYLEQELALLALEAQGSAEDRIRSLATATAAFMPKDAAALHQAGILELPDAGDIPVPAHTALKVYMEKFFRQQK